MEGKWGQMGGIVTVLLAAGGGFAAAVVVAGPGQGKAGMAGPGQTRPRLGTLGKPAKVKQTIRSSSVG